VNLGPLFTYPSHTWGGGAINVTSMRRAACLPAAVAAGRWLQAKF